MYTRKELADKVGIFVQKIKEYEEKVILILLIMKKDKKKKQFNI